MNSSGEELQHIQHRFMNWWNETHDREKAWWKHTREAFKEFVHQAGEKEMIWWRMVRHTAVVGWNETNELAEDVWDKSSEKVRSGLGYTKHQITGKSQAAWNATIDKESRMWNAIRKWFTSHATYAEELAQPNLYLNSTHMFEMLTNGYGWFDYTNDYFLINQGMDAQINQAYCAVAAVSAVLNSFQPTITSPVDPLYKPYPYATQVGIISNACVNDNVVRYNSTFDGILHAPGGLSLQQTQMLLQCFLPKGTFDIITRNLDPTKTDIDQFRLELTMALRDKNSRVIINFDQRGLGQTGGGHFSPLGGYYQTEDRFLIMDVAKYRYPSVWVSAAKLYSSMATIDVCGQANLPQAQDALFSKGKAFEKEDYLEQLARLGCTPTYRGYIIIRGKGIDST